MPENIKVPFCPKCQQKRDGKFCFDCGTRLVEGGIACPCGNTNIWPHETYCTDCGKPVERGCAYSPDTEAENSAKPTLVKRTAGIDMVPEQDPEVK